MTARMKIAILGMGDLARKIALGLAAQGVDVDLLLASRDAQRGAAFARLCAACRTGAASTRFIALDGLDQAALQAFLRQEQPDLIVQCASLLSPWALYERQDAVALALRKAGFALQLASQLPVIHNLMLAMRATARTTRDCPIINCSYPDASNAILGKLDLAPTLGIGNAGMILDLARAAYLAQHHVPAREMRVIAHHAHVAGVVSAQYASTQDCALPRVFIENEEVSDLAALFGGPPIGLERDLNALSAAHALQIIRAFLPDAAALHTSAPGPFGYAGGWPIRIQEQHISLDLPANIAQAEVAQWQQQAARLDGIAHINEDGSVLFSEAVQAALPSACRALALPLQVKDAVQRHALFTQILEQNA